MLFKILDLFCGAGGFSYGFDSNESFETVLGVDFEKAALKTFKKNFANVDTICGDISNETIKMDICNKAKKLGVNMIIGGPPCQGFSLKGKNLGLNDERNYLFLEFFDIVGRIKPEIVVVENVKNLLTSSNGYFKDQILEKFHELGYIADHTLINSKNYGVPQSRERAFFIGSLKHNIKLKKRINTEQITVRDAISDLHFLNSGEGEMELEYTISPQSEYQARMREGSYKLYNHVATNHSELALEKLRLIPAEGDKSSLPIEYHGKQLFSTTWSRLQWNSQSPTIDTRFDTPSNGRNSHPELHRAITPREAARLQSFPDKFVFLGAKSYITKQIGNAVPPLISESIAEQIIEQISKQNIETEKYSLYNDDAYSIIKKMKKEQKMVSHIITDPPYNISQENNFSTMKNPRKGVHFGDWDQEFDLYNWIKEYNEILQKGGSFIIFCSYKYISYIIKTMETIGLIPKDVLLWKKSNPMPRNIDRRYVQDLEFAIWAVKPGGKWIFNRPANSKYLRSIYEYPIVSGRERTSHPTQKNTKLLEDIILVHTNPGDIILDPFMGSGTTGVAAIRNNRVFVGIEIDQDFFDISKTRIHNQIL